MLISFTNEQKPGGNTSPVTEAGNPATLDGKPTGKFFPRFSIPTEDGLSCTLISGGSQTHKFSVTADADLDEDEIRTRCNFAVVSAEAIN